MSKLNRFLIGAGATGLLAGCSGEINSGLTQAEIDAAMQQTPTPIVQEATGENSFNTEFNPVIVIERPNDNTESTPENAQTNEEPTEIRINPEPGKNEIPKNEQSTTAPAVETIHINGGSEPEVNSEKEIIRTNPAPGEETNDTTQNEPNPFMVPVVGTDYQDIIIDPEELSSLSQQIEGQHISIAMKTDEGYEYDLQNAKGYVFNPDGSLKGRFGEVEINPGDILAAVDNDESDGRNPIIRPKGIY